jgi:Xaa-Pro dipeptidase
MLKLNPQRKKEFLDLMARRGWDLLLFYGDTWRKDHFRCLVSVCFNGPQALAVLTKEGEVRAVVTHPWDVEPVKTATGGSVICAPRLVDGLKNTLRDAGKAVVAINGLEQMEARFVRAVKEITGQVPASATTAVEEIRRVKTQEELEQIRKAAELADRGYEHFVRVARAGMTEFELVAEVEAFVKAHGAEDNFMLVASGGTEVTAMKPPTARKLQVGDSVITELTPQINGYYAQICRTLIIGSPSVAPRSRYLGCSSRSERCVPQARLRRVHRLAVHARARSQPRPVSGRTASRAREHSLHVQERHGDHLSPQHIPAALWIHGVR